MHHHMWSGKHEKKDIQKGVLLLVFSNKKKMAEVNNKMWPFFINKTAYVNKSSCASIAHVFMVFVDFPHFTTITSVDNSRQ